jgi:hypothetical protein
VTNLVCERLNSTPESRGHGQVLQPPSRRPRPGLWEGIRHEDPSYFITTREKVARDMISKQTHQDSHLAHMVKDGDARYAFDRSDPRHGQNKSKSSKAKTGNRSKDRLGQTGTMSTQSMSNSLFKSAVAGTAVRGSRRKRHTSSHVDHSKVSRQRSKLIRTRQAKIREIDAVYSKAKDVGKHHIPGASGGWVHRVQRSIRGERMMLEHLLSLVQGEQKREIERESLLLTTNVDRRQRGHLAVRVSKQRAEAADWLMRIIQVSRWFCVFIC